MFIKQFGVYVCYTPTLKGGFSIDSSNSSKKHSQELFPI